jgi:hypothetical protein
MTTVTEERVLEFPLMTAGSKTGSATAQIAIPDSLSVLGMGEEKGLDCGQFTILTRKDGDKRVVWNRMSLPEIRDAKKMFDEMVAKGMTPYRVGQDGQRTAQAMKEFDAAAEEVVFLPTKALAKG